jgi:Zn-dependent protease
MPLCKRCGSVLETGVLACRRCHALVHADELERLAASAQLLESQKDFSGARTQWLEALTLVPSDASQAAWIQERAKRLDAAKDSSAAAASNKWIKWLAPLAPIVAILTKGKALVALLNLKFLLNFGAFFGVYWALYGVWFGLGFAAQILIHELGHYIDIKRRGLPADMPVFLPGLGAYVRWQALGVSAKTRSEVSLAGPLAGGLAAAVCALMWIRTGNGLWAALARSGAALNLLNLIPVWALDGGQAFSALSREHRRLVLFGAVTLGLFTRELLLLPIALGAAWRMFTKDLPAEPSFSVASYFLALMSGLACLMWILPGAGFSVN